MVEAKEGVIQKVEKKVAVAVDRVERGNGDATVADRLLNFLSECWRMFWPMAAVALTLWYYESIRVSYYRAGALEPSWVGAVKKAQQGMIGLLLAHITRSGAFPYLKLRSLYRHNLSEFGLVFLGMVVYYGAWIIGMLAAG